MNHDDPTTALADLDTLAAPPIAWSQCPDTDTQLPAVPDAPLPAAPRWQTWLRRAHRIRCADLSPTGKPCTGTIGHVGWHHRHGRQWFGNATYPPGVRSWTPTSIRLLTAAGAAAAVTLYTVLHLLLNQYNTPTPPPPAAAAPERHCGDMDWDCTKTDAATRDAQTRHAIETPYVPPTPTPDDLYLAALRRDFNIDTALYSRSLLDYGRDACTDIAMGQTPAAVLTDVERANDGRVPSAPGQYPQFMTAVVHYANQYLCPTSGH